jgi:hypothetical protein
MRKKKSEPVTNSSNEVDKDYENDANLSTPSILVDIAKKSVKRFFKDKHENVYATIEIDGHREIVNLESTRFRHYLRLLYSKYSNSIVSAQSINSTIDHLAAFVAFRGEIRECQMRLAWVKQDKEIMYDMTDDEWRSIRITQDGWKILSGQEDIAFLRFNQTRQVDPDPHKNQLAMEHFLDMHHIESRPQRILEATWIITTFIPGIAHPINITVGPEGSSKTTYCRHRKRIIDPDDLELVSVPEHVDEFVRQQSHNHLIVYDNVKRVPAWFAEEMCKAVTGIGVTKRRLYTNDTDFVYKYRRTIILNGINNVMLDPDALDRCILTPLSRIAPEKRREEAKIEAEFNKALPHILGYIFDILAKALRLKPLVERELKRKPRMADFAVYGEAIARAMGYQPFEFLTAYENNSRRLKMEVIDSDPVSSCIVKLMKGQTSKGIYEWKGSMNRLHAVLAEIASENGIPTIGSYWPRASNALSRRINIIKTSLWDGLGIRITVSRNPNDNTSVVQILSETNSDSSKSPDIKLMN